MIAGGRWSCDHPTRSDVAPTGHSKYTKYPRPREDPLIVTRTAGLGHEAPGRGAPIASSVSAIRLADTSGWGLVLRPSVIDRDDAVEQALRSLANPCVRVSAFETNPSKSTGA